MKIYKYFIFTVILIASLQLSASTNTSTLPKIWVLHINGVNTKINDAKENLRIIEKYSEIQSNVMNWDIVYNPTLGSLFNSLNDVMRQKIQEGKDLTIDDYVIAYMDAYKLNYEINSNEYNQLKNELLERYQKDSGFVGQNFEAILKDFHDKIPPPYASVLEKINASKAKGHIPYILFVPHSQGNLYANQLWTYLVHGEHMPVQHLSILGLASPTDHIEGEGAYLSAHNDYVIKSLKLFLNFFPGTQKPLSGNYHINCGELLCHSLIESYFYDKPNQSAFSKAFWKQLEKLKNTNALRRI